MIPGGAYFQDIIAPEWIVHGLDYGDRQHGSEPLFGHIYNFIDYGFVEDGREIRARHYLDENGVALVLHAPAQDDMLLRVLVFLLMRYDTIQWIEEGPGYMPVPPAVMDIVRERMRVHMVAHSD